MLQFLLDGVENSTKNIKTKNNSWLQPDQRTPKIGLNYCDPTQKKTKPPEAEAKSHWPNITTSRLPKLSK